MALKKIGGLWKPDRPGGKAVLSGKLDDGRKVYIFPNEKGDNPKKPDYNITVKVDDEAAETQRGEVYTPVRDDEDSSPF